MSTSYILLIRSKQCQQNYKVNDIIILHPQEKIMIVDCMFYLFILKYVAESESSERETCFKL